MQCMQRSPCPCRDGDDVEMKDNAAYGKAPASNNETHYEAINKL